MPLLIVGALLMLAFAIIDLASTYRAEPFKRFDRRKTVMNQQNAATSNTFIDDGVAEIHQIEMRNRSIVQGGLLIVWIVLALLALHGGFTPFARAMFGGLCFITTLAAATLALLAFLGYLNLRQTSGGPRRSERLNAMGPQDLDA